MIRLDNRTAVISGASRGIGAETARVFVRAGANVVLLARKEAEIAALAAELGPRALAVPGDVSRYGDVVAAVEAAVDRFGALDILINNAGVIDPIAPLAASDPEGWGRAVDVNLKGVYHGMRAALPVMLGAGSGTIITVSSGAAHGPVEAWSAYCASKAGAAMLTRSAHMEAAGAGVRVMGLSPGTVATDMQRQVKASGINPVSRLDWSVHIPADWPARALLWMCGPGADGFLGREISLRDEDIRRRAGLVGPALSPAGKML